jgi:hypothetical protein
MAERGPEHLEAVAGAARRAGEVHDERLPDDARQAPGEQAVRRLRDRVGADRLRDSGRLAVEEAGRGLRRDVAGTEPRPARRQDDPSLDGQLSQRCGDRIALVRDDPALDLVPVCCQQLGEDPAARVLALAGRDAVRDGEDRRLQESASFVFSSRRTSSMTISRSTALAMS